MIVDVKAGSSEGGASHSAASHHPERAGAVRSFAPTGHRHEAEARQVLGRQDIYLSVTSIELVRGVLATAHAWVQPGTTEKDIWRAYRAAYAEEPFVRIVHDRGGIYRHPEPKLLAGTNLADVGWELDPATGRIVALAAIDNLGKGAAGTAVQCMNLMLGWEETLGLEFSGCTGLASRRKGALMNPIVIKLGGAAGVSGRAGAGGCGGAGGAGTAGRPGPRDLGRGRRAGSPRGRARAAHHLPVRARQPVHRS